jgi:hypothetical protein
VLAGSHGEVNFNKITGGDKIQVKKKDEPDKTTPCTYFG